MQLFDPNNPNEKKKIIAAAVLGIVAIAVLGYLLFGGGSKKPAPNANQVGARATPTPARTGTNQQPPEFSDDLSSVLPIVYTGTVAAASEADRNIFAYYVPPPAPAKILPTPQ